jgi:hypothetical protein
MFDLVGTTVKVLVATATDGRDRVATMAIVPRSVAAATATHDQSHQELPGPRR